MASYGGSSSKGEFRSEHDHREPLREPPREQPREQQREQQREQRGEQFIAARNETGQFVPLGKEKAEFDTSNTYGKNSDMTNMLKHIEQLESQLSTKTKQLADAQHRVEKFSARTREGMQSALDSLMKKWMDACETKDEKCKEQFQHGMKKLVEHSAEDNGVWQMMVAASALHQRQEHDLDKLRVENNELKQRIDGHYATPGARTDSALGKRKAEAEPETSVVDQSASLWDSFALDCASF